MSAYEGVRVLELTTGVAGPVAATFFADFGADVIKIEPPEGDPARATASFVSWNRGVRGAVADAAVEDDRVRVGRLIADADLVIVHDRRDLFAWGTDAESLATAPGGPVILELPSWQGTAPWFGGGESQALLAAASGYSRRQSSYDGGPVDMVYPHLLYIQAVLGATAAAAALIERLRSGAGQIVTVDGMHAVAEAFTGNYSLDPDAPLIDTAVGPRGLNPTYCHYQAQDGTWLLVGGLTPKFQERILRALGEGWIIDDPRVAGDLSTLFSPGVRDWVRDAIEARMRTRSREEWLTILRDAGVPSAPLNSPAEAFAHEHTRRLGIPVDLSDPTFGEVTVVGQPVVATATPAEIRAAAPVLGTAVDSVVWSPRAGAIAGAGWHGAVGATRTNAGPLSGLRVILLGTFVAGPFGAFLLGHLGADVVKVEAPEGDPWRERGFYYSDGMRSIVIDLKQPSGRDLFHRLATDADIVVDNLRPGVAESLGVDFSSLRAVNDDIVTLSLTGFGHDGPLAKEPGFDPVLQAWSGMCVAQGGDDTPVLYTVPVNDLSGAGLIAFGACTGAFHRLRTGEGQQLSTSLVAASMFMQSGSLVRGDFPSLVPVGGRDHLGPHALDRYYATADGWLRLQALEGTQLSQVAAALDLPASADLAEALSERRAADAVAALNAAGIPSVVARTAREVVLSGGHPGRFTLRTPQPDVSYYRPQQYAEFSRSQYHQDMYPPGAGEHTDTILDELGLTEDEQRALIDANVVVTGQPMSPRILNPYR